MHARTDVYDVTDRLQVFTSTEHVEYNLERHRQKLHPESQMLDCVCGGGQVYRKIMILRSK